MKNCKFPCYPSNVEVLNNIIIYSCYIYMDEIFTKRGKGRSENFFVIRKNTSFHVFLFNPSPQLSSPHLMTGEVSFDKTDSFKIQLFSFPNMGIRKWQNPQDFKHCLDSFSPVIVSHSCRLVDYGVRK